MQVRKPEYQTAAGCPVRWIPEHGGYWLVSRYRDVCKVLADSSRYSSMGAEIPRLESADFVPPIPFDLDPPHHGAVRRVMDALLPKSATDRLKPSVRASARTMAAMLSARGEFELMDDFAVPLVAIGLWNLLGFQQQDEVFFIDQSRALMRKMWDPSGTARWERLMARGSPANAPAGPLASPSAEQQGSRMLLEDYILNAVERGLGDDQGLLAALARARWRTYFADRVTEIMGIVIGLVGTALANTVSVLISAVEHLGTHPRDRLRLLEHHDHVASAVEEMLRLYPPQSPGRIAVRDTRLAGGELRIGDSVLASIRGANRDSEIFANPDQFVLSRVSKPHLAFGAGRHHCIGAPFARMVLAVSLEELHAAIPHYRISGWSAPVGDGPLRVPLKRLWVEPM